MVGGPVITPPPMLLAILVTLAVANAVIGGWVTASPDTFFLSALLRVFDSGPYNVHFVVDVGIVYLTTSIMYVYAIFNFKERECRPVCACAALWHIGHALWHVVELLSGRMPPIHWLLDSGVFLQSIIQAVVVIPAVWEALGGLPHPADGMVEFTPIGNRRTRRLS